MRGFMECDVRQVEKALKNYDLALEVLEWGSQLWKDVSYEDKGHMFKPEFIRGVKLLRLEALTQVRSPQLDQVVRPFIRFCQSYVMDPGPHNVQVLDELTAGADAVLEEVGGASANAKESPAQTVNEWANHLSFFAYHAGRAEAYAIPSFASTAPRAHPPPAACARSATTGGESSCAPRAAGGSPPRCGRCGSPRAGSTRAPRSASRWTTRSTPVSRPAPRTSPRQKG